MTESSDFEPPMDGRDLTQPRRRLGVSVGFRKIPYPKLGQIAEPLIIAVDHGSRAEQAGVKPGDIILTIDGQSMAALAGNTQDAVTSALEYMRRHAEEDIIWLIERDNQELEIVIKAD